MENIDAILFDVGGTLRGSKKTDPAMQPELVRQMMNSVGTELAMGEFITLLQDRARAYNHWVEGSQIDLNEEDRWTTWLLPDYPAKR